MRDVLAADRATVFEYDASHDELFATVAHGTGDREIRIPAHTGLAGAAAQTRRIVNVPDAHEDPRFNPAVDRATGYRTRSVLAIPLLADDGDLVGVAQVLNKDEGTFTAADEQVAAALAAQAAVALRRQRLIADRLMREKLERDLELASRIQQSSLPATLPTLAGFQIAAWSVPAESTGGDVYDVVALPADAVVLMMADATGHGVGPALSVMQARSMLRVALRLDAELDAIVERMNRQLVDDLPSGRFITAFFGHLDARTGTLSGFSAGQGPLFVYVAAEDRFEEIEVDAPPLGILPDLEVRFTPPRSLAAGDLLIVASDGIFEAFDASGAMFGVERAHEAIRVARTGDAESIAAALREAVRCFGGERPADDDQTVVIVKRVG
ncbi:MAG: SpoIIE family protein phosphatase [Phycisphaerales bacterium]|nr:SpoIIE family protein phosphatase [Phycisphaerales bacterium]